MDFLDSLFVGSGSRIKLCAKIFFILNLIAFIIMAIVGFCIQNLWYIGLIFLIFGPIVAYLVSLFIYSWGEHLEYAKSIASTNIAIYEEVKREVNLNVATNPRYPTPMAEGEEIKKESIAKKEENSDKPIYVGGVKDKYSKCGKTLGENSSSYYNSGYVFKKDE